MKKAQFHIKITLVLLAVLSGVQVNATTIELWNCYAQQQEESRLKDDEVEISQKIVEEGLDIEKDIEGAGAAGQTVLFDDYSSLRKQDWGETSLTKKAARGELTLYEEDIFALITYHFAYFGFYNQKRP